jgi:hypothetical protein
MAEVKRAGTVDNVHPLDVEGVCHLGDFWQFDFADCSSGDDVVVVVIGDERVVHEQMIEDYLGALSFGEGFLLGKDCLLEITVPAFEGGLFGDGVVAVERV